MIKGPRVFIFDNMTSNTYILVLNRCLAVIKYRTNLQYSFTASFVANNIVKAASVARFYRSHTFPSQSLLSSTSVCDDNDMQPTWLSYKHISQINAYRDIFLFKNLSFSLLQLDRTVSYVYTYIVNACTHRRRNQGAGLALRIGKLGNCLGPQSQRGPQDSITAKQSYLIGITY